MMQQGKLFMSNRITCYLVSHLTVEFLTIGGAGTPTSRIDHLAPVAASVERHMWL